MPYDSGPHPTQISFIQCKRTGKPTLLPRRKQYRLPQNTLLRSIAKEIGPLAHGLGPQQMCAERLAQPGPPGGLLSNSELVRIREAGSRKGSIRYPCSREAEWPSVGVVATWDLDLFSCIWRIPQRIRQNLPPAGEAEVPGAHGARVLRLQ